MENMREHLGLKRFAEFSKWMSGQTMAYINGKNIVYRSDYERWLAGLGVID